MVKILKNLIHLIKTKLSKTYYILSESFSSLLRTKIIDLTWKNFNVEVNYDWKYLTTKIIIYKSGAKTDFYDDGLTLEKN